MSANRIGAALEVSTYHCWPAPWLQSELSNKMLKQDSMLKQTYVSTAVPSLKLELRTWRHFDDSTEVMAWGPAEVPLQKRAMVRRTREKDEDLGIVEGEHLIYERAIQGELYTVEPGESDGARVVLTYCTMIQIHQHASCHREHVLINLHVTKP